MPLVTNRTQLSQGLVTAVSDLAFNTGVGADIGIDSAGSNLPALAVSEFFEVRGHSLSTNNGLYRIVTVNTINNSYEADKVSGLAPVVAGAEAADVLGATGVANEKSVFFDTQALGFYIMEQGNVDADGVTGAAWYSFEMQEWKDDNFLIANAPFPMNAIDNDAGKYIIGQDNLGNNSGWTPVDAASFGIRTRKLFRNMGWDEVDAAGVIQARYFGCVTLGTFEDPTADVAFAQFGTDTTVDDTFDLDFAGPVNEAIPFFTRLADGAVNGGTGLVVSADGQSLTRSDGGNWRTDGFLVGSKLQIRDAEQTTNDGTFRILTVADAVDGAISVGTPAVAEVGLGFDFIDGGGGNDSVVRNDGGSWVTEGYFVGGNLVVANAENVANDLTASILSVTASTIEVATATFVAGTDDNTATFGPLEDLGTPDTVLNAAIDNSDPFRIGLRVRDADPNGKTFGEANLASAGKTTLGNFVFAFPLANSTDLKIAATDATIDGSVPYTGMSVTFHPTPQVRAGLVGGSFNFGIIIDGNGGTGEQVFEWIQRQLRKLTDIDADPDIAIGRTIGLLARFVGDTLEVGSGDGGLTAPVNPDGGGSGVFIDNLNAVSANAVRFRDNTGTFRTNPETVPVTLDFNDIAINDVLAEFDLFFDRTIRTAVADMVITAGAPATITSAGTNLPNNAELGVTSYVRISGLGGGDAAMNGVYQVIAETTPGTNWSVVRYDGATIVSVASTAVNMDQNPVDTPDAIIVNTNQLVTDTTISFTAPDTIGDTNLGLGGFAVNDRIRIVGSASNDGVYTIATVVAGTITTVEQTITTEAAGASISIIKIASGFAVADFTFSFDFDGNVQGGRVVSADTFVFAKAIGFDNAQYVQSQVTTISSGSTPVIPLFAAQERNTD